MLKWFEKTDFSRPQIVYSRIRLVRNVKDYLFHGKLEEKEGRELIGRLEFETRDLKDADGMDYRFAMLEDLDEVEVKALWERRVINASSAQKKGPVGLRFSRDESISLVFNGDDHIRLQFLKTGLCLEELLDKANEMDDQLNQRFPYAFDEKYGYLTAFPTNMGTGLRSSVLVHLPLISQGRKFAGLLGDMGRFGIAVRGVYGEENFGSLYEISNQKTLGQTEKEIVEGVAKAAIQLTNQEKAARKIAVQRRRTEREDEVYKSYGVLKYARRLSARDSMIFLSQIMAGLEDGLIQFDKECSIYRIMLGCQPGNLQRISDRPLSKEEQDRMRAEFIRQELPELR